jgi:uncharacterized protein involved in exopolysaccharide biosynthesis
MNENKNNQENETPAPRTPAPSTNEPRTKEDESESLEDNIRKIKPYINKLWAKKKQFLIFNGVVLILLVLTLLFILKPYYNSTIVILPDFGNQSSMSGGLSNLASMAGLNFGDVNPNQIYEKIIFSEKVISDVVFNNYLTNEFEDSVNLIEYFEVEADNDELSIDLQRREEFLKVYKSLIENRIKTDMDRITTSLTINVTMPEPLLAADVANRLVNSLNKYITIDRQSFAKEQSEYLFNRINEVRDSLSFHEDRLKVFREKNRAISNSPQLTLEQNRLIRKVDIAQSVFIELTKQYELVKLEEVKDTPVVNVMEKAEQPMEKAGPKRKIIFVLVMFFSGLISSINILFNDKIKSYYRLLTK